MNITWTRLRLTVVSPLASMTCPRIRGWDEYYLDKTEADCRQSTGLYDLPRARGSDEYYLDKAEADCRQSTGLYDLPRARGCDEYYLDKAEADCRQSTGLDHVSQDLRL